MTQYSSGKWQEGMYLCMRSKKRERVNFFQVRLLFKINFVDTSLLQNVGYDQERNQSGNWIFSNHFISLAIPFPKVRFIPFLFSCKILFYPLLSLCSSMTLISLKICLCGSLTSQKATWMFNCIYFKTNP